MVRMLSGALALTLAAGAYAGVTPTRWLTWNVVDNGGISDGSGQNLAGTTTYDLFFTNMGDTTLNVNGFNMGTAAQPGLAPYRIFVDAPVFNHPLGSDVRSAAFEGVFPTIAFDTFLTVGSSAVSVVPGSVNLSGTSGELLGTWFTQPPVAVEAGASLRFMRLTVVGTERGSLPLFDVENSSIEVGFGDNTTGVYAFVPTPGAAALLGLGGMVAARRRR